MYLVDSLRKLQQDGEDEDRVALALQHGTAIQRDDTQKETNPTASLLIVESNLASTDLMEPARQIGTK